MSGEHFHFLIQPVELAADRVNQIPFSAAGRSVRPTSILNKTSPANKSFPHKKLTLPGECPGVCMTRKERPSSFRVWPSANRILPDLC